jgi:galactose oxidase
MEVFSPPYLFKGPRPTIDSSPTNLVWATNFSIGSQNAADIARVVLIRCGSATHGFDADQRFVELEIQSRSVPQDTLVVKAPPNGNVAPPGYYMLFVLNTNGVPSSARMVHL